MQTHISEAASPEGNMPAPFARGSRVQKMLFKVGFTFNDGEQSQCRVTFSGELLQFVGHAKNTNFERLLTGDESSFYYEYPSHSAWALLRATLPTRKAQRIQTDEMPGFHYLSTSGIHSLFTLPAGMRQDAEFSCAFFLPDME
jgi:hypothetical protein